MKVRCINVKGYEKELIEGNIYDGKLCYDSIFQEERWKIEDFEGLAFKEFRFEEVKELTFKEVIANIKEGEVWECTRKDARIKKIRINDSLIVFDYGDTITEKQSAIKGTDTFKLQRKQYTFEEAFKAYEEGKGIESFKGISYIKHYEEEYNEVISIEEIRGKWYING